MISIRKVGRTDKVLAHMIARLNANWGRGDENTLEYRKHMSNWRFSVKMLGVAKYGFSKRMIRTWGITVRGHEFKLSESFTTLFTPVPMDVNKRLLVLAHANGSPAVVARGTAAMTERLKKSLVADYQYIISPEVVEHDLREWQRTPKTRAEFEGQMKAYRACFEKRLSTKVVENSSHHG